MEIGAGDDAEPVAEPAIDDDSARKDSQTSQSVDQVRLLGKR
jgi:hypothetical protein